jgi:hypothetical protein
MKIMIVTITWRELGDRMTCLKLNESTIVMDGLSLSKRFIMSLKEIYEFEETDSFWDSVEDLV